MNPIHQLKACQGKRYMGRTSLVQAVQAKREVQVPGGTLAPAGSMLVSDIPPQKVGGEDRILVLTVSEFDNAYRPAPEAEDATDHAPPNQGASAGVPQARKRARASGRNRVAPVEDRVSDGPTTMDSLGPQKRR